MDSSIESRANKNILINEKHASSVPNTRTQSLCLPLVLSNGRDTSCHWHPRATSVSVDSGHMALHVDEAVFVRWKSVLEYAIFRHTYRYDKVSLTQFRTITIQRCGPVALVVSLYWAVARLLHIELQKRSLCLLALIASFTREINSCASHTVLILRPDSSLKLC